MGDMSWTVRWPSGDRRTVATLPGALTTLAKKHNLKLGEGSDDLDHFHFAVVEPEGVPVVLLQYRHPHPVIEVLTDIAAARDATLKRLRKLGFDEDFDWTNPDDLDQRVAHFDHVVVRDLRTKGVDWGDKGSSRVLLLTGVMVTPDHSGNRLLLPNAVRAGDGQSVSPDMGASSTTYRALRLAGFQVDSYEVDDDELNRLLQPAQTPGPIEPSIRDGELVFRARDVFRFQPRPQEGLPWVALRTTIRPEKGAEPTAEQLTAANALLDKATGIVVSALTEGRQSWPH